MSGVFGSHDDPRDPTRGHPFLRALAELQRQVDDEVHDYQARAEATDEKGTVVPDEVVVSGPEGDIVLEASPTPTAPAAPTVTTRVAGGQVVADIDWDLPDVDEYGADSIVGWEVLLLKTGATVAESHAAPTGAPVSVVVDGDAGYTAWLVPFDRLGDKGDASPVRSFTTPAAPPAPTSDGIPPASSPTPTVTGRTGWLHARWTPVANADPVTYRVYVTAAAGPGNFPLDATTFVGSNPGTGLFIKALADGTAPQYGVNYRVIVVASDKDGDAPPSSEGTGASGKLDGGVDLEAGSITADDGVILSLYVDVLEGGTISAAEILMGAGGLLRSANYTAQVNGTSTVAGTAGTGWRLTDTLAELFDVTVRGTLDTEDERGRGIYMGRGTASIKIYDNDSTDFAQQRLVAQLVGQNSSTSGRYAELIGPTVASTSAIAYLRLSGSGQTPGAGNGKALLSAGEVQVHAGVATTAVRITRDDGAGGVATDETQILGGTVIVRGKVGIAEAHVDLRNPNGTQLGRLGLISATAPFPYLRSVSSGPTALIEVEALAAGATAVAELVVRSGDRANFRPCRASSFPVGSSSRALKKNIKTPPPVPVLGRVFEWEDESAGAAGVHGGFILEELPEWTRSKDGYVLEAVLAAVAARVEQIAALPTVASQLAGVR